MTALHPQNSVAPGDPGDASVICAQSLAVTSDPFCLPDQLEGAKIYERIQVAAARAATEQFVRAEVALSNFQHAAQAAP